MELVEPRVLLSWTSTLRRIGRVLTGLPAPIAWALPIAWMGFIWFLSSQKMDAPGIAHGLWGFLGNLIHAPLFGLLALLLVAACLRPERTHNPVPGKATVVFVMLFVLAYGVVDEWHQSYTGGRTSTGWDVLTDVVGAACVLWIVAYLGSEQARERVLRRRLLIGIAVCALTAWVGML